ncbi:unnamed protein product [Didymodactylos carnosus]|uniref:NAD(P)(+)--arginine ADP-ribosyltransferase n=1 Tax=Didymodactylos carnosus TaxID=1234261 RepID=A0A8S2DI15_9BILA|nr:unnamed protein product [Didymodactylos carnosus]CAF3745512.1 unnamed protein product [Didymodactylos carnosus]
MENTSTSNSRFTDLGEEPYKLLLPIEGYQHMELMSLEDAVRPLHPLVDNLARNVWIAKDNCKSPSDSLTVDQSASIHLYTMEWKPSSNSLYSILNRTLRNEDRDSLIPWFPYLKLFLTALHNIPSADGVVYRGSNARLNMKFNRGDKFVWWGVSSCTESLDVLNKDQFLGKTDTRTLFNIQCHNAKKIQLHSHYKHENEVLLMPGTYFEVKSIADDDSNLHIIHVEETTPPYVLCASPVDKQSCKHQRLEPQLQKLDFTSELKLQETANDEEDAQSNQISDGGGEALGEALKVNKTLTNLNLQLNEISVRGAEALAEALKVNKTLTTLDLGWNQISDEGGQALAEALKLNKTLTTLHLQSNQISVREGEALADAFKVNKTFTTLNLESNPIFVRGGQALAEALKVNKTLSTLNLTVNEISDGGGEALAEALKVNKTLTTLHLQSNQISVRGGQALAEALKVNKTLTTLDLQSNQISDGGGEALAEALKVNKTLTTLNLRSNQISVRGGEALADALKLPHPFTRTVLWRFKFKVFIHNVALYRGLFSVIQNKRQRDNSRVSQTLWINDREEIVEEVRATIVDFTEVEERDTIVESPLKEKKKQR